jgi:hypothetical protein
MDTLAQSYRQTKRRLSLDHVSLTQQESLVEPN